MATWHLLHIGCHLIGTVAMLQEKNGALEAANAELQKAADTVNAANAELQQKAASFDELKVPPRTHLLFGKSKISLPIHSKHSGYFFQMHCAPGKHAQHGCAIHAHAARVQMHIASVNCSIVETMSSNAEEHVHNHRPQQGE